MGHLGQAWQGHPSTHLSESLEPVEQELTIGQGCPLDCRAEHSKNKTGGHQDRSSGYIRTLTLPAIHEHLHQLEALGTLGLG